MEWSAYLRTGIFVSSKETSLQELLGYKSALVAEFGWCDEKGFPKLKCAIPEGGDLIAFKRNYVSTDGKKQTVFVLGWKPSNYVGIETLAFLQPSGLVELSCDREYKTAFERNLVEGS